MEPVLSDWLSDGSNRIGFELWRTLFVEFFWIPSVAFKDVGRRHRQCDQMVRFYVQFWPYTIIKSTQKHRLCCKSGEISPNLVTLVVIVSETRFGYFWKVSMTNFRTKVAQIILHMAEIFWASLKILWLLLRHLLAISDLFVLNFVFSMQSKVNKSDRRRHCELMFE